jgi:hypothetical protein
VRYPTLFGHNEKAPMKQPVSRMRASGNHPGMPLRRVCPIIFASRQGAKQKVSNFENDRCQDSSVPDSCGRSGGKRLETRTAKRRVLCEIRCFLSGLCMSVLANPIARLNQDAVSCSTTSTLECDKTRTSSERVYRCDRLHSTLALSANSLVRPMHGRPPSRSLLDAEQIRELISGGMKTDAKQI